MGFSTSGAVAILFVGLLIAVGIAYPTLETAHDRRSTAMDDRDQRALEVRNTAIDVTNVTYDADAGGDANAGVLTVNATNAGSTTLDVTRTHLLVDGIYLEASDDEYATTVENVPDRESWQPGERLTFTVEGVTEEPDRTKVVTQNGVAATEVL